MKSARFRFRWSQNHAPAPLGSSAFFRGKERVRENESKARPLRGERVRCPGTGGEGLRFCSRRVRGHFVFLASARAPPDLECGSRGTPGPAVGLPLCLWRACSPRIEKLSSSTLCDGRTDSADKEKPTVRDSLWSAAAGGPQALPWGCRFVFYELARRPISKRPFSCRAPNSPLTPSARPSKLGLRKAAASCRTPKHARWPKGCRG